MLSLTGIRHFANTSHVFQPRERGVEDAAFEAFFVASEAGNSRDRLVPFVGMAQGPV